MKRIQWLLELADVKPLLFSIALLLIAVAAMAVVIQNRDSKIDQCNEEIRQVQQYYNKKLDSLSIYYREREIILNEEVKKTLNNIIDDYKNQINDQKKLSTQVSSAISENQRIIDRNKQRIKTLQQ